MGMGIWQYLMGRRKQKNWIGKSNTKKYETYNNYSNTKFFQDSHFSLLLSLLATKWREKTAVSRYLEKNVPILLLIEVKEYQVHCNKHKFIIYKFLILGRQNEQSLKHILRSNQCLDF